jgi:hypothetical protein
LARTTSFKKGTPKPPNSGRSKGTRNKSTPLLKEATLAAANLCGQDGNGKGQLIGYLRMLAREHPAVFARLLAKILPTQIDAGGTDSKKLYTPAEAAEHLRKRGLPVPPTLCEAAGAKPATDARRQKAFARSVTTRLTQ